VDLRLQATDLRKSHRIRDPAPRLVNMETHPKVGDLPIVKMLETGYKHTGDIQPARRQTLSAQYRKAWEASFPARVVAR
jgi:hypothetical protein